MQEFVAFKGLSKVRTRVFFKATITHFGKGWCSLEIPRMRCASIRNSPLFICCICPQILLPFLPRPGWFCPDILPILLAGITDRHRCHSITHSSSTHFSPFSCIFQLLSLFQVNFPQSAISSRFPFTHWWLFSQSDPFFALKCENSNQYKAGELWRGRMECRENCFQLKQEYVEMYFG